VIMKCNYKIVDGKIILQDFRPENAEDKEKAAYNRDVRGRFAVSQHAVPAKAMRQFLSELSDKHGNAGVKDVIRHYDAVAKIQELSSASAVEPVAESTPVETSALDQLFKTDYSDTDPIPVEEAGFDFYYIMKFKPSPIMVDALTRVQDRLRGMDIVWEKPEDWHVTLLYVKNADEMKIADMAIFVEEFQPVPVSLKGFGYFNDNGFVLYASVEKTPELIALQSKMYRMAKAMFLETSEYSDPAMYTPHITLGMTGITDYPEDFRPYVEIRGITLEPLHIEACVEKQVLGISPNHYKETV
jgi:2'-5' RNA ligase